MALVLMVSAAGRAAAFDADSTRWADLKKADQQMAVDFSAALKARGYTPKDLPVEKLFQEFEKAISSLQARDETNQIRLCDDIDAKARLGAFGPEKARDFKERAAKVLEARRCYLWGNFWRRLVREGFSNDSAPSCPDSAEHVLGKRIALAISDEELAQVVRENEFDPASCAIESDYFHPKKIELNIDLSKRAEREKEDFSGMRRARARVGDSTSGPEFRP